MVLQKKKENLSCDYVLVGTVVFALKCLYGDISAFSKVKRLYYNNQTGKRQMLKKKRSFDGWISLLKVETAELDI